MATSFLSRATWLILCVREAPLWHARPSRSVLIQQVCRTMQRQSLMFLYYRLRKREITLKSEVFFFPFASKLS